jgi:hypothetical protein
MGGTIKVFNVKDLVLGYENPLVLKNNAKLSDIDFRDYYFKSGDAVLYNPDVTPFV